MKKPVLLTTLLYQLVSQITLGMLFAEFFEQSLPDIFSLSVILSDSWTRSGSGYSLLAVTHLGVHLIY